MSGPARVRLGIALAVAVACLALPAAASAQATLTPAQFAAIDAVYGAFAAFDDGDGATAGDRSAARAACTALGSGDALLAALRRACSGQLKVGAALGATARCEGRTSCLLGVRRVRRALSELLVFSRALNRAVADTGLPAACGRELRVSMATLRYLTRLRAGFAELERALRIGSRTLARRAQRRIDALDEPDPRPVAQQREDFRAGCAPPA